MKVLKESSETGNVYEQENKEVCELSTYPRARFEDPPAMNFNQPIVTSCEYSQGTVPPKTSNVATGSSDTWKEKDKSRSTAHEVHVHIAVYSANRMYSFRSQFNPLACVFKMQRRRYITSNVFLVQWKLLRMHLDLQILR